MIKLKYNTEKERSEIATMLSIMVSGKQDQSSKIDENLWVLDFGNDWQLSFSDDSILSVHYRYNEKENLTDNLKEQLLYMLNAELVLD